MADFIYSFGGVCTDASVRGGLSNCRTTAAPGLDLFFNEGTLTQVTDGEDSLTLFGHAHDCRERETFADLLRSFSERDIARVKQRFGGQWLMIVRKGSALYLFSDFLQTRCIYYDVQGRRASSSFGALYSPGERDDYKAFEWLAMRHCLYPSWLGGSTLDATVCRLPAYRYLVVDLPTGTIEARDLSFEVDNRKIGRFSELREYTLDAMRRSIRHPELKKTGVRSTVTGGFDSRLAAVLVGEYYSPSLRGARVGGWKGCCSRDIEIARQVAAELDEPLEVYYTDPDTQKELFYTMTDGLAPRENAVTTQMLLAADAAQVGFGGVFGTELYSVFSSCSEEELVDCYVSRVRTRFRADEAFFERFARSLRGELEAVRTHYRLAAEEPRDRIRLFHLLVTGTFSAQMIAAENVCGRQYELFGCYPVIEAGLRTPYNFLGSKWTLGRFYLVPKSIMFRLNASLANIDTTHFCPMRPFGPGSFFAYLAGRFRRRRYYRKRAAEEIRPCRLTLKTAAFEYCSDEWFEGFLNTYYKEK